jgi:hypothetical protein
MCVLYDGQSERDRVLMPYLHGGVRAGSKCVFATSDTDAAGMLTDLGEDTGMPAAVRSGQLAVRSAEGRPARPGESAITRLITLWENETRAAMADGYGFARLGAEAKCWLPPRPDSAAFARYETELGHYLPTCQQTALCLYDMDYFDASVVMGIVKFHPKAMVNGLVLENPYYLDVRHQTV